MITQPIKPGRLYAIDQCRALAIVAMMIAHFMPGVIERVPFLEAHAFEILFLGRFATPAFVLVFGITIGYVHFAHWQERDQHAVSSRLYARARLVAACAVLLCIPRYMTLIAEDNIGFGPVLLATYSVLNFYVLGLLSAPLWLRLLGTQPIRNGVILGAAHWALAWALLKIVPQAPASLPIAQFAEVNLLTGSYAYLQASGSALLAIPIGILLRRSVQKNQVLQFSIYGSGFAVILSLSGWAIGSVLGEFNTADIVSGVLKAAPRFWYWLFFAGPTLMMLVLFLNIGKLNTSWNKILYPLTLFGQAALPIYTAHRFVLPLLHATDFVTPIEGGARIIGPFLLFGIFCLAVMYRYHLKHPAQVKTR